MSSDNTRLPLSVSGTSPLTIRCARPSTIAVLPTPGSPISTGLFLVRRLSTCMARRISSSRPMIGSILPCSAASVRSRAYLPSASNVSSAEALSALTNLGYGPSEAAAAVAEAAATEPDAATAALIRAALKSLAPKD